VPCSTPLLVYAFDVACIRLANALFRDIAPIVYYCQDFEPSFPPNGSEYVEALRATFSVDNMVVSTTLLYNFLLNSQAISAKNIWVTSPEISPVEIRESIPGQIFCYFRPEEFNRRNLSNLLLEACLELAESGMEYRFFLVGSVETDLAFKVKNSDFIFLSKLEKNDYISLMASSSAVVSLIYSAHPGVIAFQSASSGIPTVTNTFDNRSSNYLSKISKNIIPWNPLTDRLSDAIVRALSQERGVPDFEASMYSQNAPDSFAEFNTRIIQEFNNFGEFPTHSGTNR
jgi:hypothetical protein